METIRRADYLIHCDGGFILHCDHRNLKYTADKLQRWSRLLQGLKFSVKEISGEDNVWADLLSRWGSTLQSVCAIRTIVAPLSPQMDEEFEWPQEEEIRSSQASAMRKKSMKEEWKTAMKCGADDLVRNNEGKVWIPPTAVELKTKLCVRAHFGMAVRT